MITLILIAILTYLIGSVNVSILLMKWRGQDDPRQHFSRNPGATNIWRQAGSGWAIAVLLLDMGKAVGTGLLALYFFPAEYGSWVGLLLILGNRFPCFHGFRGGKGVAHYFGFSLVFVPWAVAGGGLLWLTVHQLWRQPFLGSLIAVSLLSGALMAGSGWQGSFMAGTLLTTLLIIINHHSNIETFTGKRM